MKKHFLMLGNHDCFVIDERTVLDSDAEQVYETLKLPQYSATNTIILDLGELFLSFKYQKCL